MENELDVKSEHQADPIKKLIIQGLVGGLILGIILVILIFLFESRYVNVVKIISMIILLVHLNTIKPNKHKLIFGSTWLVAFFITIYLTSQLLILLK
jgi:hypothetical protein